MSVVEPAGSRKKSGLLDGVLGKGKAIWLAAIACAIIAALGALTILGNAAATTTYYVLNRDIAARTQITPDMLAPVTTKAGGAPVNAFDLAYVRDHELFARVALRANDVVTGSTAGPLERITTKLPSNFVAASFQVAPENAVAGKVRAGDYIDLIATNTDDAAGAGQTAKVVLHHVLVLDVTVAPASVAEAANDGQEGEEATGQVGPESEALRSGIPQIYTVGLSPEDAARLALIKGLDLLVVLSGNAAPGEMDVQAQIGDVFSGPVKDSGAGTSSSTAKPDDEKPEAPATEGTPSAATPEATSTAPAAP